MATRAEEFRKVKSQICDAVSRIFGDFTSDFVVVKDKSEEEVRQYLQDELASNHLSPANVDKYVYIAELFGDTIIKR